MTIYRGVKINGGMGHQPVYIKDGDSITTLSPSASQELVNHSPDGFNWGYGGSGPAQLALALLYDVTEDKYISLANYQDFKRRCVAQWGDHWEITDKEIQNWLKRRIEGLLL